MKKRVMLFILILLALPLASASLGISPSKKTVNFQPGLEVEYLFNVFADTGQRIELYSAGEFAELVEFDRKELIGGGSFTVKIKLPNSIGKPGKHRILIGAREKADLEEGETGLGTSAAVQAPIDILVPYPGKYAEISLYATNANVGDFVEFKVAVSSKGEEPILAITNLEIYSEEKKIETLYLGSKSIESQKSETFKTFLNTSDYKAGDYKAIALVDYQAGIARAEKEFRIGSLFVNITDYSKDIVKKGIQPFNIKIESLWNNDIEKVYGEIYVAKNGENITNFLTPSVDLKKWEKKTLEGHIDTDKLDISEYDLKIKINYQERSTVTEDKLKVKREINLIFYIIGIALLIAIILYSLYYLRKKWLKKK